MHKRSSLPITRFSAFSLLNTCLQMWSGILQMLALPVTVIRKKSGHHLWITHIHLTAVSFNKKMESWHKYSIFTLIVYLCKMNRKALFSVYWLVFVLSGCSRYRKFRWKTSPSANSTWQACPPRGWRSKPRWTTHRGRLQLTGMNGTLNMKERNLPSLTWIRPLFCPRSVSTNEGVMSLKISDMSVLFSVHRPGRIVAWWDKTFFWRHF